ncbi:MAG: hypothetical protein L0H25_00240 [Micrococcales bacterium]|nr:hypothetical protein [Micrococcales bacterium]
MQTLIAFAATGGFSRREAEAGIGRVEQHYATLWREAAIPNWRVGDSSGLMLWEAAGPLSLWPGWSATREVAVASVYVPLGHERLTGSVPLADAPAALANALRHRPSAVHDIGPPFVLAARDERTGDLDVFNDAIGAGRLFEVTREGLWVWSNRPVAALLFAGVTAAPSATGWHHQAVADEFFGLQTPWEGVRAFDGSTRVHWDGRKRRRLITSIDLSATWARLDRPDELAAEAASALKTVASSVGRLYSQTPVVDLTGGRDSRLVAAAFLSAGADVVLHTHDAVPGDLNTALELVNLIPLDRRPEHVVDHVAAADGTGARPTVAALSHAIAWHRYAEGLRPASYLYSRAPRTLDEGVRLVVGGAGGEAAHGYYYPRDLEEIKSEPLEQRIETFARRVLTRHAPAAGQAPAARDAVYQHVATVLRGLAARGVTDSRMLDFFYVLERMRRWGTTGERLGTVSPLLDSSWLRAALSIGQSERQANALHRDLLRDLMPSWVDVPFYPGEVAVSPHSRPSPTPGLIRLADASDRRDIEALLDAPELWSEAFDVTMIRQMWGRSLDGSGTPRDEATLKAVMWRGGFGDFCAMVNGSAPPARLPLPKVPEASALVHPELPALVQPEPPPRPTTEGRAKSTLRTVLRPVRKLPLGDRAVRSAGKLVRGTRRRVLVRLDHAVMTRHDGADDPGSG